ncbi:FAD-binding oxidoreductase [Spirosoma soli]|uniref:FAD-binding oxidoreductase n=1 Tax=Spirosoma soli TaxID=1770529 RepID=A0ABW5M8X5_9BACT
MDPTFASVVISYTHMQRLFLSFLITMVALGLTSIGQAQTANPAAESRPITVRKSASGSTPATYKGRQILVGSGGGFTGAYTTYYLLDNGQLFGRRGRDTTFTFIGEQTSVNTKRVFTALEQACKIKTTRFDKPGNLYKFVEWRKGKQSYKVTWSASQAEASGVTVPVNYPAFYNSFMKMIPAAVRLN